MSHRLWGTWRDTDSSNYVRKQAYNSTLENCLVAQLGEFSSSPPKLESYQSLVLQTVGHHTDSKGR